MLQLQMCAFKKFSKTFHKKGGLPENSPNEMQHIEGRVITQNETRIRPANWTDSLDSSLLGLMREEHTLVNYINGIFTTISLD